MTKGKDARGVTLLELLMVVAIIGILAAIAYPAYLEEIRRSKRAEGQGVLLETAQALEKCKALYGIYNSANCGTVDAITSGSYISSAEDFYRINSVSLNVADFELQAVPTKPDPKCGTLTLDQNGDEGYDGTGSAQGCW